MLYLSVSDCPSTEEKTRGGGEGGGDGGGDG